MKIISPTAGNPLKGFGSLLLAGAITAIFGFTGCSTPLASSSKVIQIDSNPSNMRVEVNGEDLGRTPTSYTVRPNNKGDFAGNLAESPLIIFTAYPGEGTKDLYIQRKTFSPSAFMEKGDRVPEKIFFDMHNVSGR